MPPSFSSRGILCFGAFEADLGSGELRKHGLKIKLQDQPFQVLAMLLDRTGEVVTREELRERLWPSDTFVDFDHSLNSAINKLREALNDTADQPRFIETLPRRGYRFLAPVEKRGRSSRTAGARVMLAVLPFENLSRDSEQDYFADGMTEEMIAQLGRLNPQRLGVIARTSAMQYKGTNKRADQIGAELGVDYLLEGSVRRADGRVRITAQLIRVSDQSHLWSDSYDHKLEDVLAIQSEVGSHIARSLAFELLPSQQDLMARRVTRNSGAYEDYLRGRFYLNKREEEGFAKSVEYYNLAIQKDPSFALAYAGLADACNICGLYGALPPQMAYATSKSAAQKALEIDDHLAEAHSALAFVLLQYDWNWPTAEQAHRRAIELNPNYASGHDWYALALMEVGRFADALAQLERARELDPLSLVVNAHLGWLFYFERKYDRAVAQLRQTLDLAPDYSLALYFLGEVYIKQGDFARAIEALQKALERTGNHPVALSALVHAYGAAGQEEEARQALAQLRELATRRYVSPYFMAYALAGLRGNEEVFECLESAYRERSGWVFHLKMKIEPAFDRIRSHPRFVRLLEQLEEAASHAAAAESK